MIDVNIFDMDGTLCDVEPIRHYVTGPRRERNFTAFHNASLFCAPHPMAMAIYRHPAVQHRPTVIVTARDARFERVTRDWLTKHGITYAALFMRPWGDIRHDTEVKADILSEIRGAGFTPILAVDDRDDIIAVWESNGIPTIKV